MKYTVVTTFHKKGWDRYAKNSIESWKKFLPKDIEILVYYEDMDKPEVESENIKYFDFDKECGNKQQAFEKIAAPYEKEKNASLEGTVNFRYQASRFAHKYFACEDAISKSSTDYLIWIDADVIVTKPTPIEFFDSLHEQNKYWSAIFRGRDYKTSQYPECGFMIWNVKHPYHNRYWQLMDWMYSGGNLFKLREWHDSFVWWSVEQYMLKENKSDISKDLGDGRKGHAFVRGILGEYMDHCKGDSRKDLGFSPERTKR